MNVEQLEELAQEVPPVPPARPQSKLQEIQTTAVFRSSLATPPDTPPSRTASQSMADDTVFEFRAIPEKDSQDPPTIVSATRPMTPAPKVATGQKTVAVPLARSKTSPPSSAVGAPITIFPIVSRTQAPAPIVPTTPVESVKRSGSPSPPVLMPSVHSTSSSTPRTKPAVSVSSWRENISTRSNFVNSDLAPPAPPSTPANTVVREASNQQVSTLSKHHTPILLKFFK